MLRLAKRAVLLPACGLLAVAVAAQGPIADFERADYVLEVDGRTADAAQVWQSKIAGAFLILSDDLEVPVLLRLRDASVEGVNLMKVDRRADGHLTLLPEPVISDLGKFQVSEDGAGVTFAVGGRQVDLREKPPLLGRHALDGMKEYSGAYVRAAAAYRPSGPILARLRAENRPVKVEVFFGTWCPYCQQVLPRIMRVDEELGGSNIEVGYYGLPRGFGSDPLVDRMEISGVPTGIVYVGDREVGRITGNGWKIPELTINSLLVRPAGGSG